MPKYSVTVNFTRSSQKDIIVFAHDEEQAREKAEDVVLKWDNVVDAEAGECVAI